jgi:hypothetical protein
MSKYSEKEDAGKTPTEEQIGRIKSIMLISDSVLPDLIADAFPEDGNDRGGLYEVDEPDDLYRLEAQQIIDNYYNGKMRGQRPGEPLHDPPKGISGAMLSTTYNKKDKKSIGVEQSRRLVAVLSTLKMTVKDIVGVVFGPESPVKGRVHTVYDLTQLEAYTLLVHPICEMAEREMQFSQRNLKRGKSKDIDDDFIDIFG